MQSFLPGSAQHICLSQESADSCWCAGVSYAIASGAKVAFGQPDCVFEVVFDEAKSVTDSPLLETLLKGMAAGGSADVQRKIRESLE